MQMTLLQCDLTRLPTDATEEMFAPYLMAPQFHLGEIAVALQWVSRSLADSIIGGRDEVGLGRFETMPPDPSSKASWQCWVDTVELGRRRVGGRTVRFRHVWQSEKFPATSLPEADAAMGTHHYGLNWPIDRGGGLLQIELVCPGVRDAPIPPAQLADILSAFTIAPTLPGHVVQSEARIAGDMLELSGVVVPKITRSWGTIQPRQFDAGHTSWNLRFSGLGKARSILVSAPGADLDAQVASLAAFADRWDAALTKLPELLSRGVALLIEEMAGYGEPVEDLATLDHHLYFDFAPPTEDDDPEKDDPDSRLRLISEVEGRNSDDESVLSGKIEIDAAGNLETQAG